MKFFTGRITTCQVHPDLNLVKPYTLSRCWAISARLFQAQAFQPGQNSARRCWNTGGRLWVSIYQDSQAFDIPEQSERGSPQIMPGQGGQFLEGTGHGPTALLLFLTGAGPPGPPTSAWHRLSLCRGPGTQVFLISVLTGKELRHPNIDIPRHGPGASCIMQKWV